MRALTLEYHDVLPASDAFDDSGFPGAGANSYKVTLSGFEAHLDRLPRGPGVGADVRALSPATPGLPVLITFDDGGRSALDVIAPALERRGLTGHFFMTTSRLGAPGFLSDAALRELASRGHVVGSHSHSHPVRMARLTDAALDAEWATSRDILEEILGASVTVASVPGGYFSRRVAAAAARAGIRWLFTSEPVTSIQTLEGCEVFGRYTLRHDSLASDISALLSPRGTGRAKQWLMWNAKKVAKVVAGDAYLRLRRTLLGENT